MTRSAQASFRSPNGGVKTGPKIAEAASVFLHQQKFEKGANFQQVTAALNKIAETSDRLTVIVVFFFQRHAVRQRKSKIAPSKPGGPSKRTAPCRL